MQPFVGKGPKAFFDSLEDRDGVFRPGFFAAAPKGEKLFFRQTRI